MVWSLEAFHRKTGVNSKNNKFKLKIKTEGSKGVSHAMYLLYNNSQTSIYHAPPITRECCFSQIPGLHVK